MTQTEQFINERGITFKIERNGQIISEEKALQGEDTATSKKYFRFLPSADVETGDWVIGFSEKRFYVTNTIPCSAFGKPSELKAYYQTSAEHNSNPEMATAIFNIANATNSVIGMQSTVTMNINSSIQKAKEKIASSDSSDKEELQQIISLLEMVVNNQVPAQKGLLSKFSAVMERNSWITGTISSVLLNWLLTQAHTVLP